MPDSGDPSGLRTQVDPEKIPKHVAIIMDGNGRWAKRRRRPRVFGHRAGVNSARLAVEAAVGLGVEVLTLYAFSEENWGRPNDEVATIFSLLDRYIVAEKEKLAKHNVRFKVIGRVEALPTKTQRNIRETTEYLSSNTGMILVIALSYGARQEIAMACQAIAEKSACGELCPSEITSELVQQHLTTALLPDPDLFIRTSGEQRISNFLLWQLAYTELWFTDKLWPDFGKDDFYQAVLDFQKRERRYGRITAVEHQALVL